jgi:hypothetical protein
VALNLLVSGLMSSVFKLFRAAILGFILFIALSFIIAQVVLAYPPLPRHKPKVLTSNKVSKDSNSQFVHPLPIDLEALEKSDQNPSNLDSLNSDEDEEKVIPLPRRKPKFPEENLSHRQKLLELDLSLVQNPADHRELLDAYEKGKDAFIDYLTEYSFEIPHDNPEKPPRKAYPYRCFEDRQMSKEELHDIAKEIMRVWRKQAAIEKWLEPVLTDELKSAVRKELHLNEFAKLLTPFYSSEKFGPREPLANLLAWFQAHKHQIKNKRVLTFIDLRLHSGKKRLFRFDIQNLKYGQISLKADFTSHGKGSDPKSGGGGGTGFATDFGNTDPEEFSGKSSIGFYIASSIYCTSNHGTGLKLHGVSSTNDRAFEREIIIHGARYVNDRVVRNFNRVGRSFGCPAIDNKVAKKVIDELKGGSLLYIYGIDTADKDPIK